MSRFGDRSYRTSKCRDSEIAPTKRSRFGNRSYWTSNGRDIARDHISPKILQARQVDRQKHLCVPRVQPRNHPDQ